MGLFIREKKIDCGTYREVDIIPRTDEADQTAKGKRRKRKKVTEPAQKDLNDKNARRYLIQICNGNFGVGDLHISATYDKKHLPETVEDAEKNITNYLRRISYRRTKQSLPPLKYILVTEYGFAEDGTLIRIHHHIIMNGGLSREEVELMWTRQRINWKRQRSDPEYRVEPIGYINADRLQPNENGIEALCKYITKNPQGKKRWSSSRNLKRPIEQPPADHKYSVRKVENLAKSADSGREYFEHQFPGYDIIEIRPEYYEKTGWHIYFKMWKKKKGKGKRRI